MTIRNQIALLMVALPVSFAATVTQASVGEVFLLGGMASGSYGTGSESDVATTRVVFNTGDKYQFKVDAGWIRIESPLGILPSPVGPVPAKRKRAGGSTETDMGVGPSTTGTGTNAGQQSNPNQPDVPEPEPPIAEPDEVSASGLGDLYLAFSRRMFGGGVKVFRMDGGVEVKAPTADADEGLGTGEWDARIGLTSEYRFWSATGFAGLGWNYLGNPEWVELNNVVDAYAGMESEPLAGRVIVSGWVAGNPEVVSGVGSRGVLGLGVRTTGQWRFRFQATTGLTDGSEDFTLLFGVSHGVATPTVGTRGPRR